MDSIALRRDMKNNCERKCQRSCKNKDLVGDDFELFLKLWTEIAGLMQSCTIIIIISVPLYVLI